MLLVFQLFQDHYKLEIKSLDLTDAGEYKVVIKNKVGEKSHQGVLSLSGKVEYSDNKIRNNLMLNTKIGVAEYRKPLLIANSGLRDIKLKKGDKVAVTVTFTADPNPEIVWLKDGKPISENKSLALKVTSKDLEHGLKQYECSLNILEGKSH